MSKALDLGPRDRILDWMLHRAIDFRSEKRPGDALRLLDRVIAERPDDWLSYALRAEAHADKGDMVAREADIDRALAHDTEVQFLLRHRRRTGSRRPLVRSGSALRPRHRDGSGPV